MTTASVAILLVDDNAGKRLALKTVLLPLGYRIVEADSGVAALRCILAEDFAVILLDVCMPRMDGFETAALIRQRAKSEMTPIIFITAYARDEIPEGDLYAGGAVDFIFAPVVPTELRAKVSVFGQLFQKTALLAVQAQENQATADQLRLLTDAAPIGIFQTDRKNRYIYTNPQWTEITGVSAEAAAGQPWDMFIGRTERAGILADIARGGGGELNLRFEVRVPGSDPRIVFAASKAVSDGRGGVTGWVGTLADVTAGVRAEDVMAEARDAALRANVRQQNFTASASHELRTPTTSILGFVEEVLHNTDLTEEDRGFLEVAHRNAQRLSRLIDDLLILGEAEIGPSMMELRPTAPLPLVEQVVMVFSTMAERGGITLVVDPEPHLPDALIDPRRLEQALVNLVSNALKFTPDGGKVQVAIRSGDGVIDISVADTGTGIDPADLANIFDRFYRTKRAVETATKGTGLGLAIAQKMVEAQNGHISVTSVLGQGSTFTMTLPAVARQPLPN